MKILCLNESLIMGGQEKIFIEYLKVLKDTDYDIDILIEEDNGEMNSLTKEIPLKYLKKIRYLCNFKLMNKVETSRKKRKGSFLEKLKYSFYLKKQSKEAKKKMYEFLESNKYDLVLDFSNILEPDMAIRKNIRWIHSSIGRLKGKKLELFKKKIKNSKYTIVIANEMREEIISKVGLEEKLKTIYNPFDIERIKKLSNDDKFLSKKEKKLLKEDYLVTVSRLDNAHKNIKGLVEAYSLAKRKGLKEKLYIVGEGNDRKEIETQIEKLKLKKDIILLGLKNNPYIWIENSKCFILNSNWEGLPTVLIESLILEKIIISTKCKTGPQEILENGKYGVLIDIKNSEELSEKMIEVLNNKKLRSQINLKIEKSIERFKKSEVKNQLIKLIENK